MAYDRVVGDPTLPFEISSGTLGGLLDDLVLRDALEAAGIEREPAGPGEVQTTDLELDCDELYALVAVLNEMYLNGDEEAGQAYEALLEQLGFTLV